MEMDISVRTFRFGHRTDVAGERLVEADDPGVNASPNGHLLHIPAPHVASVLHSRAFCVSCQSSGNTLCTTSNTL